MDAAARPLPAVIAWLEPLAGVSDPALSRERRSRSVAAPLRPPGAIDEAAFLAACTRCGKCQAACEPGAIQIADPRFGRASGTPWIDPAAAPCLLCEDFPCVAACEPGALAQTLAGPIGTACVRETECLNRLGSPCATCVERCPVPGAIRLGARTPIVEPGVCTGCGVCAHVCPAPTKAILILPARRIATARATDSVRGA
jgi:MauM/NapG family ferredoxin protein